MHMPLKKAKTRFSLDEIRDLIRHNTQIYKDEDGFSDFIVELTTYLLTMRGKVTAPAEIESGFEDDQSSKRVPIPLMDPKSADQSQDSVMELPPTVRQLQRRSSGSIDLVDVAPFKKRAESRQSKEMPTLPRDNVLTPPPADTLGRRDPHLPPPKQAPLTAPVISESFIDSDSTRKNVLPPSISTSRSSSEINIRASRTPTGVKRPPGAPPPKAPPPQRQGPPPQGQRRPPAPANPPQQKRISPPPPSRQSMSGEINVSGIRPTGSRTRVYKVSKTSSTVMEVSCWNCAQMYSATEQCCPSCGAKKRK